MGAEAASHFACLFFYNTRSLKIYHSFKSLFIHSLVHIPEHIIGEC